MIEIEIERDDDDNDDDRKRENKPNPERWLCDACMFLQSYCNVVVAPLATVPSIDTTNDFAHAQPFGIPDTIGAKNSKGKSAPIRKPIMTCIAPRDPKRLSSKGAGKTDETRCLFCKSDAST